MSARMHAAAWRALCAVHQSHPPSACQTIAGVRRPLARNFHRSAVAYQASEDPAGAATSENKDGSDKSEEDTRGKLGAEDAENTTQSNDTQRARRRPGYGSGVRRASRNRQVAGLPPLVLPEWFWERNVTCYGEPEDAAQRVDIKYTMEGLKEYEPIENNALLSLDSNKKPVLNRQAVKQLEMEIHVTEALRKEIVSLLERFKESKGKAPKPDLTVSRREAYADLPLEASFSEELSEKSILKQRYVAPMRKLLEVTRSNDASPLKDPSYWYSLPEDIYVEIYSLFCAELKLTPPKIDRKDVYRQDTLLVCPRYGGLKFLNAVVQKVANVLEADVIRLDSEDIAQIVGEYLGEDVAWTRNPTAVLGYATHGHLDKSCSSGKDDSIDDEDDAADDTYENDETHSPFDSSDVDAKGNRSAFQATFAILQAPSKPFQGQNFSKGMNLAKFLEQSASSGPLVAQSAKSSKSWNEYKTGRAIEAIINSADVKRARSVSSTAEAQQALECAALPASKGLIIQICDYKELNGQLYGYNLLHTLREVVKKHWYDGRSIMIVGTTAENAQRTSSQARKSIGDQTSSDVASDRPRSIFVPPGCHSVRITDDRKVQIRDSNIRHVEHMIRRLLGTDDESKWEIDLKKDLLVDYDVAESILIDEAVWGHNHVRRIAMTMLGIVGLDRLLDGTSLKHALVMLRRSDKTKLKWAGRDDRERGPIKNLAEALLSGVSTRVENIVIEKEGKLEKLKRQCTTHEKKLLGGVIDTSDIHTTFADVRAPPETIEALKTLTSLSLIRPDSFSYGVLATDKIPGLLLYGPPGTGKTLLAKAVAKESGATMLEISASEINDMYVGEGEKNVKAVFSLAKKLSPCVVFIDEADSLFGSRGDRFQRKSHRETINQFLREWDGMTNLSTFIMVATNRPFDLDEAVLRRLPRRLLVDLPIEKDREAILKIHLKGEYLDTSISLATLAKNTPFYSGSDLKNLSVAAALACVQEENEMAGKHTGQEPYVYPSIRTLRKEHFDKAMEEISASISEDMSTLSAIRKFDERYGDRKGRRKKGSGIGFGGTTDPEPDSEAGRVRKIQLNL